MLGRLVSPSWAVAEYVWYPLLLFAATPWFLHRLGAEQYGHWMLLTATVGLGGVLNVGTGAATVKMVSAGIGRGDRTDAGRIVRASLAIAMLGGAMLALLVAGAYLIGGPALLGRMGDPALLRVTAIAAVVLLWLEQVDNVYSSALRGAERFGHSARLEIAAKTVQLLFAALVLLAWQRLWALYAALVVVALARLLAKALFARQLLGLGRMFPAWEGARELLHYAKWGWLQGIGGVLFGVADRMLVGSLLGAASLAWYSIASQLAMQAHAVSAAGLSVIFPAVSRKREDGKPFTLWRVTWLSVSANLLLSTAIAIALLLLGTPLLHLWLGSDAAGPTSQVLPWLVVAYWLLALNIVPYYVLLGMGRVRFVGLTVLVAGIVATIAMYFAVIDRGLAGAPLGRGVYALLTLALAWPLAQHLLRERSAMRGERPPVPVPYNETLP